MFAFTPARAVCTVVLLAAWASAQCAEPIRICITDIAYPPYLYPDREGSIQWLVRQAALHTGLRADFAPMPIKRCIAQIAAGQMDARIAGSSAVTRAGLRFPMKDGVTDAGRALGSAREMLFRLKNSPVEWDGRQMEHVTGPVLMQPGFPTTELLLKRFGVQIDSGGKTLEANLGKLLAGRGQLAIGFEFYAAGVLARPEFSGKIEMLPIPIHEAGYYLAFSPAYYAAHGADVERLWAACAEVRHGAEYEALRQALAKGAGAAAR
jgi:polar amino acid transport system substrate-binding protein